MAICGANGSGKSSIIKALLTQINYEGLIKFRENTRISYLSQGLNYPDISLNDYILDRGVNPKTFASFLASFDFRGKILDNNLANFSEGEKRKIALALSIHENADIYIWDEPLNYLDINLRLKVEAAILKYNPTIIFVEHDSSFVKKISTNIINL